MLRGKSQSQGKIHLPSKEVLEFAQNMYNRKYSHHRKSVRNDFAVRVREKPKDQSGIKLRLQIKDLVKLIERTKGVFGTVQPLKQPIAFRSLKGKKLLDAVRGRIVQLGRDNAIEQDMFLTELGVSKTERLILPALKL